MMFPKNKKTFRVSFGNSVVIVPMDKIQAAVEEALKDMDISGGSASVEMRVSGEYIQYSTDGNRWYNLIALSDLQGAPGADYVLTDADIAEIAKQVAATVEPDLVIGFNRAHVLLDTISANTFYVESGSLSAIKEMVIAGKSPNIEIRCVISGAGNHTEYNFTPSGHYYNFKTGDDYIIIEFVARFGASLKEYTIKAVNNDIVLNRFSEAISNNASGEDVPVIKSAEQPEFVETIEECTDRNKAYVLPDGYIYAYGTRHGKQYTNIFPTLEGETKGEPYNGVGYADNTYMFWGEPFDVSYSNFHFLTGFIPYTTDKVFRARGVPWNTNIDNHMVFMYDSDKKHLGDGQNSKLGYIIVHDNGDLETNTSEFVKWFPDVAYIRLCVYKGDDPTVPPDFDSMIMTINQEIDEDEVEVEGFHNTGIAYLPVDNEDRIIALEKDVKKLKDSGGGNVTFDYAAYGLPELALRGTVSGMSKDEAKPLDYVCGYYVYDEASGDPVYVERSGTCTCKWQGSSSIAYPKKNYTIKFDTAFEAFDKYGEQTKYCFKANYIDHSHARNIVCARLWGDIVRSRNTENATLKAIPNCGAIDGFPCVITINGEYQGLYTFNIPKDGWMFGMGNGSNEAIICAENDSTATRFEAEAVIGNHFSLEYAPDEDNADWVGTSINRLITAVGTVYANNGANFDATLSPYLDLESAIDYYIFTTLIGGLDITNKNYLLVTYDGTRWFFSAYDMDSTFGLYWDGKSFTGADWYGLKYYQEINRLMYLIYTYKKDALKARYTQLRNGVLSESNVINKFTNFVCNIPERIYLSDTEVWPTIPSTSASNLAQITAWYQERLKAIDEQMGAL